jgi:hypothetical protein
MEVVEFAALGILGAGIISLFIVYVILIWGE